MENNEILKTAVRALQDKMGRNLQIIRVGDLTVLAHYFVLASGGSSTQVKALADEVEHKLSEKGLRPKRTEGYHGANWIVLDYIDVVLHIFHQETREFYDLERLWQDGEFLNPDDFVADK
ncbi:MAG: ribosome silencing factor [Oscillospiraceae bacterium]|jgi:ribosome-associated protein|nr:ribosome silencing factor [Oscillospiraceae bacterium]